MSESDIYRCQILTSNVDPRTAWFRPIHKCFSVVRVKLLICISLWLAVLIGLQYFDFIFFKPALDFSSTEKIDFINTLYTYSRQSQYLLFRSRAVAVQMDSDEERLKELVPYIISLHV